MIRFLTMLALAVGLSVTGATAKDGLPGDLDPENTILLDLKGGQVVIEMYPDKAPLHVERIKTLARQGFYDGIVFHRVIDGFMAQTGDPTGTGSGGSDLPDLPAEFNDVPHTRGILSMARTNDPNSANSQFFIVFDQADFLDNKYTVWGKVVSGMEYVDRIQRGEPPQNPDKIVRLRVAKDALEGIEPKKPVVQNPRETKAGEVDIISPVLKNP